MELTKGDHAVEVIGAMMAAMMMTNSEVDIDGASIRFRGSMQDHENSVTRALQAALNTVPYHALVDILLDVQRRQLLEKGCAVPPHADELSNVVAFKPGPQPRYGT
jgi:hypothetical protein